MLPVLLLRALHEVWGWLIWSAVVKAVFCWGQSWLWGVIWPLGRRLASA